MKKKEIKVQVTFSEGYQERFTEACIKVAEKRIKAKEEANKQPQKVAV